MAFKKLWYCFWFPVWHIRSLKLPILTHKKLNKLKNQQPPLDSTDVGSERHHCPQNWRYQQENAENCNLSEPKPKRINLHGNQCQGREIWTVTDKLLDIILRINLRDINSRGNPDIRDPPLLWVLFLRSWPGSHSEYQRKIPLGFQQGVEGNHFEIYQSILFFFTKPALKRNYLTRA